jgi:hypothetical protein
MPRRGGCGPLGCLLLALGALLCMLALGAVIQWVLGIVGGLVV